jgi:hypothetical protein
MTDRYSVELTEQAKEDVKKLRPWGEQVIRTLLILDSEPLHSHVLTSSLRGARSLEVSLKGSGVYRAVYIVRDHRRVLAARRALPDE